MAKSTVTTQDLEDQLASLEERIQKLLEEAQKNPPQIDEPPPPAPEPQMEPKVEPPAEPQPEPQPTGSGGNGKSRQQILEEYEKDYLARLIKQEHEAAKKQQEAAELEAKQKAEQSSSTRGSLPKGF